MVISLYRSQFLILFLIRLVPELDIVPFFSPACIGSHHSRFEDIVKMDYSDGFPFPVGDYQ